MTMYPIRRVDSDIQGINIDDRDKTVVVPKGCVIQIIKEMGKFCSVGVREMKTKQIITLRCEYRHIWNSTHPFSA